MSIVRQRRLEADFEAVQRYVSQHPSLRLVETSGSPPQLYSIDYQVQSQGNVGGRLIPMHGHLLKITLTDAYPKSAPECRLEVPVFHPNIQQDQILVESLWNEHGSLVALIAQIGEILSYQRFNLSNAVNPEAVRWVRANEENLPLDSVSFAASEKEGETSSGATTTRILAKELSHPQAETTPSINALPDVAIPDVVRLECPHCGTAYRVRQNVLGKIAQCKKCRNTFELKVPDEFGHGQ